MRRKQAEFDQIRLVIFSMSHYRLSATAHALFYRENRLLGEGKAKI
jgi:hypothetical protein